MDPFFDHMVHITGDSGSDVAEQEGSGSGNEKEEGDEDKEDTQDEGTTTVRIETPDANANNGGLLVNCINDMCKDDDTKDYHVEYYDDLVSFREAALPSSQSDATSITRIIKE